MKTVSRWEAVKALDEGKKVRHKGWMEGHFIEFSEKGYFLDQLGRECRFNYLEGSYWKDGWVIVEESYNSFFLRTLVAENKELRERIVALEKALKEGTCILETNHNAPTITTFCSSKED